jgi:hypothetical protein
MYAIFNGINQGIYEARSSVVPLCAAVSNGVAILSFDDQIVWVLRKSGTRDGAKRGALQADARMPRTSISISNPFEIEKLKKLAY